MNINPEDMKFFIGMFPPKTFSNGTCHIIPSFGNIGVIETAEGLVVFDIALKQFAKRNFQTLRKITDKPIKYIIFSHCHFDHAFGFEPFIKEINKKGWRMPEVIAHENGIKRFEKYQMLDKYHAWLNAQQFASIRTDQEDVVSPHEILTPTIVLKGNDASYSFDLGGVNFKIFHDKGETDDSIWLWVPQKKLICAGDLMVSSFPNVGNPYKVQRYPKDWAIAMDKMREKKVEYLLPGHGQLIEGEDKVDEVLSITSEAMHFVHDEVVKRLNEGKWFEQIYHEMLEIFPDKFKHHEILRPVYGCYQFAIHAAYRLYHGWYNTGNPTDLFPAKSSDVAQELLRLNPPEIYLKHARNLFNEHKLQLALHILDIVIKGLNEDNTLLLEALNLKLAILKQQIKHESSFIAGNILNNGALQIQSKIERLKTKLK